MTKVTQISQIFTDSRKHHHAEAEGQGCDEQGLFVHQGFRLLQEERDEVDAHREPEDKEETHLQDGREHLRALKLLADCQCREHHHEHTIYSPGSIYANPMLVVTCTWLSMMPGMINLPPRSLTSPS
jgi:hypothetical protein